MRIRARAEDTLDEAHKEKEEANGGGGRAAVGIECWAMPQPTTAIPVSLFFHG